MTVRGKKNIVSVDPDEGHVIRDLNTGAMAQRELQLPPDITAELMSAMGFDYHKNSLKRGWAVAMAKAVVGDLKDVARVREAIQDIAAYAKEHEQSGPSDRESFRVEWADEQLANLFFSYNRKPEWDILTYTNKGPHTASSPARLEFYSKGRKIDEKVLDEIVAHVTGLYARPNDGAVEKCKGCRIEHDGQPYSENRVWQESENGHLKAEYVKLHTKYENSELYNNPQTVGSFVLNPKTGEYDYMCDRMKFRMMKLKPEVAVGPDGKELTITIRGEVKPKFAKEPDPNHPGRTRTKMLPGAEFVDRATAARIMAAKERKSQNRAHDDEVDTQYRPRREERGRGGYSDRSQGRFNTPRRDSR